MDVILIRSAQTNGGAENKYIGSTDEPLNAAGIRRAITSGVMTHVFHVYASTAIRAAQTATIKFPYARVTLLPGLREMDYGDFERRTPEELADDPRYRAWIESGGFGECPNGEGRIRFAARACIAFSEIIDESLRMGRGSVIIVAHAGTVMSVMERFARPTKTFGEWGAPHCGGYRAYLDERTWERVPVLTEVQRL